jgi:hypothetical protein
LDDRDRELPLPANDRARTLKLAGVEDTPPEEEEQRQRFADLTGDGAATNCWLLLNALSATVAHGSA